VLLRFRFKLSGTNEATAFKRIMRPQGVALPVLGCAVWVKLDDTGTTYADVRVSIAPVAPRPTRIPEVEAALIGQPATEDTLRTAIQVAREVLNPRTSKYRATADYRREMIEVLLRRTLPLAVERARTGDAIPEDIGI
jgi:carbon-monoxide dehydrogenase medium subunit